MLINGKRALAYTVRVGAISPIEGADNIALAHVGGWPIIVKKDEFKEGDLAVFFEIDSKLPEEERYSFLANKHYKIKTMKLNKFGVFSQGLLMPIKDFMDIPGYHEAIYEGSRHSEDVTAAYIDLTDILGVKYAEPEDNARKGKIDPNAKYTSMKARHKKFFSNPMVKKLMRYDWFKKFIFIFLGKKKDSPKAFPSQFPYVKKTDQERAENIFNVCENKTPLIRTQKCDGSSGTFILSKKRNFLGKIKYEFYVCSRNVRMLSPEQDCFYDNNYYWDVATKYDIENKLKDYLIKNPELDYVCWQGEICGPKIQGNPHKLTTIHFYCFHMIDSKIGKYDIRDAEKIWDSYDMEVVPIDKELYIMPDSFEEFKISADGNYDKKVCEGNINCAREGYVYYDSTNPNYSYKNVSRTYLLKH